MSRIGVILKLYTLFSMHNFANFEFFFSLRFWRFGLTVGWVLKFLNAFPEFYNLSMHVIVVSYFVCFIIWLLKVSFPALVFVHRMETK